MRKVILLMLLAVLSNSAMAELVEVTSSVTVEQMYNKIKLNKSLNDSNERFNIEKMSRGDVIKNSHYAPWLAAKDGNEERDKEILDLEKLLETKSNNGDSLATFYLAVLKKDYAERELAMSDGKEEYWTGSAKKDFDLAIKLFKRSCEMGISAACWNASVIYANGYGTTSSKLAATEWYYKAGVGYLKDGNREQALAALEAIQAIRMDSELGKRLEKQLNKGAPK